MRKIITGIYAIDNVANGKVYVGSSQDVVNRWNHHRQQLRRGIHHKSKCGKTSHLQAAWNKYGESAFRFHLLEECPVDELIQREQAWIDLLKPEERYNQAPKAESPRGVKHSEQARKNMSEAHKGKKQTPEAIAKRVQQMIGRKRGPMSEEQKAKIRATKAGRKLSEEHKMKISVSMKKFKQKEAA